MPLPLYLLALAVFAMGTSEFMLAGLLPDIASDLDVTVATAGALTSAFAIGMVVGAPLVAALARNWPRRAALLVFVLVFAAAHVVAAVTTSFPTLFATRVVAALANAGFLAVALTTTAALVPPDRKGRALAVLLAGTTLATIAGVPGGAVLGTWLGWRAAFWAVAALCLPAALGILTGIPAGRAANRATGGPALRSELARLARPRLVLAMLLGALVNAATFGSLTFLAPVVTDGAGLDESWVSAALVLFGAGSFAGVTVAGRLSDRRPGTVLAVGGPLLLVGWPALAMLAAEPGALFVLVFVQGALSFALGGTLITRVLYEAAGAPTMAGAYATAALNVGAAVGPVVAAATLDGGAGTLGPLWASGVLVAVALLVALAGRASRMIA
ncbi:Cmx/CmrA family chloramphenicol efflux MFS transporter [Streptomyces sp. NRRL F-5650]|uniref:Cmx/CmrA family chloramphenicol efflux MFS transporter n=1 Tax=Streptomyces sp. NRRL F-5650 TaxID=1463868 RepID=UPI0004C5AB16|nr:Cmx/CmrA family chloramphenicol efflux MFS transporter [Streptomyces sp. NRRL F-5650]